MKKLICVTLKVLLIIVEILCFTDFKAFGSVNDCSPAIKGKEYKLSGTIKHSIPEKMDLLWIKNKTPVSMCKSNMACYEYSDVSTLTTIEHMADNIFQYNITIKNVFYHDEGVWSLKYLGLASLRTSEPLFSCILNVYDKSALVLYDCPEIVEEENSVRCWCGTNNSAGVDINLDWFDAYGFEINTTDNMIVYNATRRNTGFQCRGRTSTGEKIAPVNYKPLIVAKAKSIQCSIHYNKSDWKISCMIERVYPQAACHFDIQVYTNSTLLEMELEPELKSIAYTHEYFDIGRLYFKSSCTLNLPTLPYLSNYIIIVSVNPNVTGSDSDLIYAMNKTVSGYYVPSIDEDEEKITNLTSMLMIIIVCVVGINCLLLIFLCGILRTTTKQSRFREKSSTDDNNMLDHKETSHISTRKLNETNTHFYTEKLEQDFHLIGDFIDDLESLGVELKHGKSSEEK